MTLQEFENSLKAAVPEVFKLAAPKGKLRYAVWHTYGGSSLYGDNRNQIDLPKVQIDIVCQQTDDPLVEAVCDALWRMELPYTVTGEGYDPEYNACRTILQLVVT